MKKIFLFFAAILCAMSAGAAQVTPNGKYFYFKTSSTWNVDNPRYSVYFAWRNGGGEDKTWASCKTVPGTTDILYVTAPGEFWDIYFCRMNGSTTDNKDANVWNKTDKLQYDGSKNFWTKNAAWDGKTTYSTYVPAISSVTLSDNGTSIISGTGTQADPYLVYAETTIKVKGAGTKVLDDPDAKLNYNFKQGTTSKQEGTSATYQFTASATADTEYIINLDGYTKVNTTKSTVTKSATALYYKTVERAEETNTVTISYKCGDKDVQTGITEVVGVSTTSSFTAPTNITGYKFTNWTIGAGIDLKASTASDATITVVTKSASSDYTLVANYEEVKETVYFINAGKWSDVYLHLWNGNATGTEWPGSQLTATGEKIGEYDVYAHTAKQGDHTNLLFHKKDDDSKKTADLTWSEGVDKYYIHNYNGNTGWYTQSDAEELLVVPVVYETVYFVNNKNWSLVQIHAWKDAANNGWPGQALTATGEKVEGFDVYSFEAAQGTYTNLIFNNKEGDAGEQSENYVWTADKYYYMGAAENYAGGTKEEVAVLVAPDPLATDVYLAGDMTNKDNWDVNKKEFRKATNDATIASVTVTLAAQTYKFKLVVGGAWKGNTGTMQRGGDAVHEGGWSFDKDGYDDNCQIVADIAGDYTFTWNLTDTKLTVTYPPLPKHQVTATVNPAETGTVTGIGEYEQGSEATLVATPAAGYAFKNWTVGGTEKSTEATYTFTVNEPISLVANFIPEVTHEVTVSYLCNDTPIPGQAETKLAVGVTTPSTISAPAITNYKFDSWTLGTGVQSEDDSKNPISITSKSTGEYTLAANYTKIELTYNVTVPAGTEKCYIAGEMNSWAFQEMTKIDETHYTITIEGATTEHKYKYACQESWDYVELKADGSGVDDRTYNANDVVAKWSTLAKCYLMGNGDWDNGVEMEYDSENGQYILLCHHISAPFKFKIGDEWTDQVENDSENEVAWVESEPGSGLYNITLPEGDYNFYFKKDSKKAYIEVSTPTLNRTVPVGYYATVCLSQNIIKVVGATLFEVAGKDGDKVIFDEVLTPVAGMPYIFLAEENTISFYCGIETAATPGDHKSLHGTFEDMVDAELDGMYMVQNNKIVKCAATGCNIPANRAYFNGTELEALGVPPTPMPGRRRITMGAESENTATGVEGIIVPEGQTIKVISNGQLIIIRNGQMYNAQGQKL